MRQGNDYEHRDALKGNVLLQYFIWGSWLVTLGSYMINTLHFTGANVGMVYSSKGIAAIIMPGIMGIIADKWLRAERAYMLCHLVCAGVLFYAASVTDPDMMFWVMLVNAMAFMPTIALSNSVSYSCLAQAGLDPVTAFPPIRVFGTVGFIVAMWAVSLLHLELSSLQLYIASGASLLLSAYALTLPKIPVAEKKRPHRLPASWVWMPSCCLKIHAWPSFPLCHDAGCGTANYQRFW